MKKYVYSEAKQVAVCGDFAGRQLNYVKAVITRFLG